MKKIHLLPFLILTASLFFSCEKEAINQPSSPLSNVTSGNNISASEIDPCGTPEEHILWAGQNMNAGTVTVSNDQTNVYVTYQTTGNWLIKKVHIYVGDCALIPTNNAGNPQVGLFPFQNSFSPMVNSFTYSYPLDQLGACYCVAAHAELVEMDGAGNILQTQTGWADGTDFGGNSWATKFEYCTQECEDCTIQAGDFRTQTIGGWGASPNGSNSGTYLHANFSSAFPNGLTVGCSSGNTILLTSAQAVTNLLPSAGSNSVLTQSLIDPADINSTFGSQLIALALSIGFDNYDLNFGASSNNLEDLVIASGPFAGWTVGQLFNEANLVYGGCSSSFSAAELNTAISNLNSVLTAINQNFDDGNQNNGYLTCP